MGGAWGFGTTLQQAIGVVAPGVGDQGDLLLSCCPGGAASPTWSRQPAGMWLL
jgi:hypothetical protein